MVYIFWQKVLRLSDKVWTICFLSKIVVFPYCEDDQQKKANGSYLIICRQACSDKYKLRNSSSSESFASQSPIEVSF